MNCRTRDLFAEVAELATGTPDERSTQRLESELGAYEALWLREGTSFKSLARLFRGRPGARPSDLVPGAEAGRALHAARELIARSGIGELMLLVHGMAAYPTRLRDARHPIEVLYAQGRPEILERDAIAVVGTRSPSRAGAACARAAARHLARRGFVILSGLAAGIDALAHHAAIDAGAVTAAVLGTPLTAVYPPAHAALQRRLAREFLLLSQVPIVRHAREGPTENRHFFRERNATLAALARAVVIVEAGDRSGALICARHALEQGRRVFMAARSRGDARLAWPARLERQGAIVVRDLGEIDEHLAA